MTNSEANEMTELFNKYSGLDLNEEMTHNEQTKMTAFGFINRTETILKEEIKSRAPTVDLDNLTDKQKTAFQNALIEQMLYVINIGDFTLISGYDNNSNSLTDLRELRKRTYSPIAIKILKNSGLLFSGITNYHYDSDWWRY